jgi:hypothetical protein
VLLGSLVFVFRVVMKLRPAEATIAAPGGS